MRLAALFAGFIFAVGALAHGTGARAQELGSLVPAHAFFGGIGAGYNYTNFGSQDVYAVGTSDNYSGGELVSTGSAAGPGYISVPSPSSAMPDVQIGYFQHFNRSAMLWGFKFAYADLLARASADNVGIPQAGAYTYTQSGAVVPFTGVAVVDSYHVQALSRISFIPFIGRSFSKGFVYFGMGPTITKTETNMNGLVGYAYVNGNDTNVSGAPQNFSSTGWVMGGALDVGGAYFVMPGWFVNADYIAAKTAAQTGNYASSFVNSTTNPGVTTQGTLVGSSSENIMTQSLIVTINKTF